MITKFTIYGERCSGTNYLEILIKMNFDIDITWEYGWKHFFGFRDLSNSNDTLFVAIVRNPYDWINSFYENPYHLCDEVKINSVSFLNNTIYSFYNDNPGEIMEDRNILTGERYKNIFELRHIKLQYLLETLPLKVTNYILIRYEDLLYDFNNTIQKFERFLPIKNKNLYPINTTIDVKRETNYISKKYDYISKEMINQQPDFNITYEKQLNYL
jgi:hypothetical protein